MLVLEWHFNDFIGKDTGINDYRISDKQTKRSLCFTAGRATCSGFNKVASGSALTQTQSQIVKKLLRFARGDERQKVELTLDMSRLDLKDRRRLTELVTRLPGGQGPLLPSIGVVEYAAFGNSADQVYSKRGGTRKPDSLLTGPIKHPMVPLECADTFSTIKEAGVQLAYSIVAADAESEEALRLWASKPHRARLLKNGDFAVLGVNFNAFPKLGSVRDEVHYRLPRELACDIQVPDRRRSGSKLKCKEFLASDVRDLPAHDIFIQITSHPLKAFGDASTLSNDAPADYFRLEIVPHVRSFTASAQMDTVAALQKPDNSRWHAILLNQAHDAISLVDLTNANGIEPKEKAAAGRWLLNWMDWNAEQLQVIKGIKAAKGGMIIVMGPAGTGKTLLQQALSIYFWKLGYHILAVAPANSNANHLAAIVHKVAGKQAPETGRHPFLTDVEFLRLFPGSRDIGLDEMTEKQAPHRLPGHEKGRSLPFPELLFALNEHEEEKSTARKYDVVHAVIDEADRREVTRQEENNNTNTDVASTNSWAILAEFMATYRKGGKAREALLASANESSMTKYKTAYRACKGCVLVARGTLANVMHMLTLRLGTS